MSSSSTTTVSLGHVYADTSCSARSAGVTFWNFQYEADKPVPLHEHNAAYICMLVSGDAHESDGKEDISYSEARAMYLPKYSTHSGQIGPAGARMIAFEIDEIALQFEDPEFLLPEQKQKISDRRTLNQLFSIACHPKSISGGNISADLVNEILASLLGDIRESSPSWVDTVKEAINDNIEDIPSGSQLAEVVGRHPAHLMRVFKMETGITVGEYIRAAKVEKACQLLLEKRQSLAMIAQLCGFADQSHFTRVFHSAIGQTPKKYRQLR